MSRLSATQTLRGGVALPYPSSCPHGDHVSAQIRPALLVVDCQLAFTSTGSRSRAAGADSAVPVINGLISLFSASGLPVAATRHSHSVRPEPGGMGSWWRSFIMEGTPGACLDPGLHLERIDAVFTKDRYSAFHGTGLAQFLEERAVSSLVLCGFQTHICVESTARTAFDLGLDVVVLPEACGSVSTGLHEAALLCMGHALARIATVRDLEAWLGAR